MADDKTKFDLGYFFTGEGAKDWYKALGNGWRLAVVAILLVIVLAGLSQVWRFFFPAKSGNVNKPTALVLPGGRVDKIDQTSTQILVEEKTWEIGMGGAALTFDNKSGLLVGGWVKKKW